MCEEHIIYNFLGCIRDGDQCIKVTFDLIFLTHRISSNSKLTLTPQIHLYLFVTYFFIVNLTSVIYRLK